MPFYIKCNISVLVSLTMLFVGHASIHTWQRNTHAFNWELFWKPTFGIQKPNCKRAYIPLTCLATSDKCLKYVLVSIYHLQNICIPHGALALIQNTSEVEKTSEDFELSELWSFGGRGQCIAIPGGVSILGLDSCESGSGVSVFDVEKLESWRRSLSAKYVVSYMMLYVEYDVAMFCRWTFWQLSCLPHLTSTSATARGSAILGLCTARPRALPQQVQHEAEEKSTVPAVGVVENWNRASKDFHRPS